MIILYPIPESVKTMDDYKPIPEGLNITESIGLIENLYSVLGNAFSCHSELLSMELYNDIVKLKTDVFLTLIRSYSSGRIASIIGNNKYSETDRATEKAVDFIMQADPEQIEQINVQDIDSVIVQCYHDQLKPGVY